MTVWLLLLCFVRLDISEGPDGPSPVGLLVAPAPGPVEVDGRLDESVWEYAPVYPLKPSRDQMEKGVTVQEPGTVQLAYDRAYLYAAFDFTDSDVVQENGEDQKSHFQAGDVAELFLKPVEETWYWELYVTPNGLRSAFFFPGRGRYALPSAYTYESDLKVGAQVDGTLNEWRDRDQGWTAEMAIPLAELAGMGVPLSAGHPWTVLVGRYNYSRYLDAAELSMQPPLSATKFHNVEEYAPLILMPPEE